MTNPETPKFISPLDSLGIVLTQEEQEELLLRLERRAIETAEDDQPASLDYEDGLRRRFVRNIFQHTSGI